MRRAWLQLAGHGGGCTGGSYAGRHHGGRHRAFNCCCCARPRELLRRARCRDYRGFAVVLTSSHVTQCYHRGYSTGVVGNVLIELSDALDPLVVRAA